MSAAVTVSPTTKSVVITPATKNASWDAALVRFNAARAAAEAAEWENDEAEADNAAWRVLMELPAPNMRALHWKLEQLFGHPTKDGFSDSWAIELTDMLVADADRLAKMEG